MKISVLCTDPGHPVIPSLRAWCSGIAAEGHAVSVYHDKSQLPGGDVLFLVSCGQLIRDGDRKKYRKSLVLHASDLPAGRGWSPHIWAVLNGEEQITVCLLEAEDPVDSGAVWLKQQFKLNGDELLPEINEKLFAAETGLMTEAVKGFDTIVPVPQRGEPGPCLRKRSPQDSRLDVEKSIAEQFDLLRTVDNERYPAFIEYRGSKYIVKVEKEYEQ